MFGAILGGLVIFLIVCRVANHPIVDNIVFGVAAAVALHHYVITDEGWETCIMLGFLVFFIMIALDNNRICKVVKTVIISIFYGLFAAAFVDISEEAFAMTFLLVSGCIAWVRFVQIQDMEFASDANRARRKKRKQEKREEAIKKARKKAGIKDVITYADGSRLVILEDPEPDPEQ